MNPAIVAPDAFDIIDLSAGGQLTTDQRRNLGSIAKMLQHAASNKMFLGDNAHLSIINEYLSQSYQKFRYGRGARDLTGSVGVFLSLRVKTRLKTTPGFPWAAIVQDPGVMCTELQEAVKRIFELLKRIPVK